MCWDRRPPVRCGPLPRSGQHGFECGFLRQRQQQPPFLGANPSVSRPLQCGHGPGPATSSVAPTTTVTCPSMMMTTCSLSIEWGPLAANAGRSTLQLHGPAPWRSQRANAQCAELELGSARERGNGHGDAVIVNPAGERAEFLRACDGDVKVMRRALWSLPSAIAHQPAGVRHRRF